ncbi:MAG TPA: 5'-nucleotidase C-terminal domain-containing protein, partial [Candidatus Avilachnospira avicola]|nr:5'-nucleotidase C-terminal domain-containing protein [Candidatus Avilachnospira avicola]
PIGLGSTVSMRDISAAYPFANTLVVLEVDRDVIRQLLERCASYFVLRDGRPEISDTFLKPKVEHYNYDFFAGIRYEFDIRRPVGDRVTMLTRDDGRPLEGKLRLCTSNYRASGTGGYEVLSVCPVLYRGSREMPDIITEYIRDKSPVKLPKEHPFRVIF